MNGTNGNNSPKLYDRVRVPSRPELGTGEVLRIAEFAGVYQADVAFDSPEGRKLETIPLELLESTADLWQRLADGDFDDSESYRLKQLAFEFIYSNNGGELSSSRVNLLPHQILLVHDLVAMRDRRLLIADEVGLVASDLLRDAGGALGDVAVHGLLPHGAGGRDERLGRVRDEQRGQRRDRGHPLQREGEKREKKRVGGQ